jgi:hypothetical protein
VVAADSDHNGKRPGRWKRPTLRPAHHPDAGDEMQFGILVSVDDAVVRVAIRCVCPRPQPRSLELSNRSGSRSTRAPSYTPRRLTQVCGGRSPAVLMRLARQLGRREPVPPA